MARLSRVHFAGLGTDSARFNPVTLDFRDAQGRASHAVMWLRNGGGKTTMLSFLYSTLRPHANDWLGRHNGRQTDLLEYVKERQTGYVLLEFEFPNLGIRRVVGQAISKRSAREPKRVYFTFRGDGPVPWEKIPLTGLGEPAGSLELFVEKMRSLGEGAGNSLEFYQTDRQGDWRTHLDSIGLDPEIYHTHLLMNADEGGLLNFFDFNSPEIFVEKLLDMAFETLPPVEEAGDKQEREDLTAVIEKFRQKVFARPNLDATAAFCQHTLSALEALKTELDVVGQFRQQREVYRGQAARLLVSVERHLTTLKAEVEQLTKEREVSAKAKKDALSRRADHLKFKKHYDRRRQLLILKESEIALLEAEQNKVKEEAWLAALKTAHRRRRLTECERLIAGFVRQKQELESAHEPDRKALERLGRAISDILSQRIAELETRFNRLTTERGGAHREWQGLQADLLKLAKEMTGADHSLATVRAFLNEADNERRKLRDQGVLLPPAETGAEAVKRWQGKAQSHQDNAGRLAVEISNGEARSAGLGHQVKEKQNQCVTVSSEIARLNTWLETMSLQAMRLRTEAMIMRELGDAPNADLHNPALETALTRFADDCQRTYLAKTVEGAADRRIVEYCRNHPNTTFPAPVGIEHVIEKLRTAGVTSAIPAYRWLSENCEAGEAARRMLLQPALYAGVVVQIPKELEVARSVIMADGLDLPVMVGVPADLATSDSQPRQHTILPEEKGFFSTALAQINLVRVVNRAAGRDAEIDQLKVDQKATEGVLGRLREHVRTYPAKSVEEKRSEQDVQQRLLAAHQAALEDLNKEISTLTDRLKELREKKQVQEGDAASAREHLGRAQGFFSTYESRVPTRREEERLLIGTIQGLTARENEIKGRVTSLEELMGRLDPQIATTRLDQRDFTLRKQLLPAQFIGTEPATDAGEDLPSLFDAFEGKRRDYEGQVKASYFDAKVEEEQKHKAAVEGEQMRDPVRPPEADVDLAMAETDLAKAVEDQVAVIADVAVEVTTARRALEKADRPPPLAQSERDTPHPDFGVPETSVQAAEFAQQCENLSAQFETEASAADTNLTLVSNRHEVSARACDRYDNFPARLRPLAAELAGVAEASGEFCGDDVKDRVLVDTVETNFKSCQDDLDRAQTRAGRIYTEQYTGVFQLRELEGKTIDAVEKMRRLPRGDLEERVSFWIEEIRTHSRVVVAELAEFAQEQKTVLGLMNDCVRDAEAVLTAAQTRSKMPENMGAWAGHHFLRIAVRRRNDLPERLVLLERMLSEWIDSKNPKPIPSGAKLAYHCLVAVAGKGQIEVKILKPEYNLRPFQHDIVKLKSFSGGEQVTAAIILYCIIVKLRAQRRGRATSLAEDSGFLLLDNPLGKANLPDFVDLQISMADRMGVQYICGTGINDLDALAGFPKIIRLRNSSINPRTGANIVEVEGQEYADISVATLGNKDHGKTGA